MTDSNLATADYLSNAQLDSKTRGRRITSNSNHKIRWVIVHSAICCDGDTTGAENLANYLTDNNAGGRRVSWHYNSDRDSIVQTLPENWIGRHTGSSVVDNGSVAIEMAVNIPENESTWFNDEDYNGTLKVTAMLVADICERNGIPKEALTIQQLKDGKSGVISHNLSRLAFGGSSHYDPGPSFPWPEFMELVRGEEVEPIEDPAPSTSVSDSWEDNLWLEVLFQMGSWAVIRALYAHHLGRGATNAEVNRWVKQYDEFNIEVIRDLNWAIGQSDEAKKRRG